jgi:hypothetical protein
MAPVTHAVTPANAVIWSELARLKVKIQPLLSHFSFQINKLFLKGL